MLSAYKLNEVIEADAVNLLIFWQSDLLGFRIAARRANHDS